MVQPIADHRQRAETDAVRAKADHLDHVAPAFHAAVRPQFDIIAQAAFDQRAMRQPQADFGRQTDMAERMGARRACAAFVAGDVDDVRAGFGDADGDNADAGDDRDFDRDFCQWIGGFEFVNQLSEVFNRVEVVIVARRNQIDAGSGAAAPARPAR